MEAIVSGESQLGEGSLNNNVIKNNFAKEETAIENDYKTLPANIDVGADEKDRVGNLSCPLPSVEISAEATMALPEETPVMQCDLFTNRETGDNKEYERIMPNDEDVREKLWSLEEVTPVSICEEQKRDLILTPSRGRIVWTDVPPSGFNSSLVQAPSRHLDDPLHRYSFDVPPPMSEEESGTSPIRECADVCSARDSIQNFAHSDVSHLGDDDVTSEKGNIYSDDENLSECKEEKSEPKIPQEDQIAHLAPDHKELSGLERNECFPPNISKGLSVSEISEEGSLSSGVTTITCSDPINLETDKPMELPPENTHTFNKAEATGDEICVNILKHIDQSQEYSEDPSNKSAPEPGKEEKPQTASVKGKKGKKGKERNKEVIIDEDVLNEVKRMIEKTQSKEKEDLGEEGVKNKTKSREKKKKAIKTKRSNSKSEGTSPTCLLPEDYPIAQRRKLKRGVIWKKESEACPSPTSDPGSSRPLSGDKDMEKSVPHDEPQRASTKGVNYSPAPTLGNNCDIGHSTHHCESLLETKETTQLCLPKPNEKISTENETRESSCWTLDTINIDRPTSEFLSTTVDNDLEDAASFEASFDVTIPFAGTPVGSRDSEEEEALASYDELTNSGDVNEMSSATNKSASSDYFPPEKIVIEDEWNDGIKGDNLVTVSGMNLNEEQIPVSEKTGVIESGKEDSCYDPNVYTFNATVSVIKPLKPTLEFVSDHSSPLSSRSSSVDRETVVANRFCAHEQSALIDTPSLKDISLCPLFDSIEASKLDGTNKIKMRNKKRHSLPTSKSARHQILASRSFDSPMTNQSFHSFLDVDQENVNKSYEHAGELLYNEKCNCDTGETISTKMADLGKNASISSDPTFHLEITGASPVESKSFPKTKSDSDDSDATDTWHHKNIKEKIKNIIGSRLQPQHDRVFFTDKDDATRADSPFPRSSSHSASSSKSSSEPRDESRSEMTVKYGVLDNTEDLSSFSAPVSLSPHIGSDLEAGTNKFEGETEVGKYQNKTNEPEGETDVGKCQSKINEVEGETEVGKYQSKLNLNLKHLSLTYLTDSEVEALDTEITPEDAMLMKERQDAGLTRIVERWETLQVKAAERQRQSTQLRQLQRQVKNLRLSMERVMSRCSAFTHPHTLDDPSQIGHKVEVAKSLLDETENLRNDLSSLNVMVHRFTSEIGSTFTPLKDEMAELYRLWDETNRRVNGELSRLQSAEATWRLWEEQKTELSQALKQDSDTLKIIDAAIDSGRLTETVTASVHDVAKLLNERRLHPNEIKARNQTSAGDVPGKEPKTRLDFGRKEDRLSDSGTSGYESCSSDDLSERERRLAYLRRLARDLEVSLVPGSKAWNDISSTLAEAEKELKGLQDQCRNLLLRTAETLDPSSKQPRFSSNSRRRNWARENKNCRSPRVERRTKNAAPRREWIWRVVRAALPFQAALLLLFCVACLLEPNCCNSVNTLNSFAPQLRFVQGSLPV